MVMWIEIQSHGYGSPANRRPESEKNDLTHPTPPVANSWLRHCTRLLFEAAKVVFGDCRSAFWTRCWVTWNFGWHAVGLLFRALLLGDFLLWTSGNRDAAMSCDPARPMTSIHASPVAAADADASGDAEPTLKDANVTRWSRGQTTPATLRQSPIRALTY